MFIVVEGLEGSGKTTLVNKLGEYYANGYSSRNVVQTREPGGTPLAEAIRLLFKSPDYNPDGITESFMVSAARRDHVNNVIRPTLDAGGMVICDRYILSTLGLQGANGVDVETLLDLNHYATDGLTPDLTIILDISSETMRERFLSEGRNVPDRLDEKNDDYHNRARQIYHEYAQDNPEDTVIITGTLSPDEVFKVATMYIDERENKMAYDNGFTGRVWRSS